MGDVNEENRRGHPDAPPGMRRWHVMGDSARASLLIFGAGRAEVFFRELDTK